MEELIVIVGIFLCPIIIVFTIVMAYRTPN